jgi:sugar phosphate isomerase/epimerase
MNTNRRDFCKKITASACGLAVGSSVFSVDFPAEKFFEGIGVCTKISQGSLLSKVGFSFIEEGVQSFLVPTKSEKEFISILNLAKELDIPVLACNSFLPESLKCVGEESVHSEILKITETAFRRAKTAGVKYIVFGSGGSRRIPDGFPREKARQQFVSLCSQIGLIAEKYDVTLVIEPLNKKECNFINYVKEGGEIVREINHQNIMLLADLYHMKMENEGPESIVEYGALLRHVHIAEKEGRSAPGTHGDDFLPYYKALKKVNYNRNISIECKWENMEGQAEVAFNSINKQLEDLIGL